MKITQFCFIAVIVTLAHASEDQEAAIARTDPLKCHPKVLQYYGFEGWSTAKEPNPDQEDGGLGKCVGMEYSCCSEDDFNKSDEMWKSNVRKIKSYLTRMFRIIQKIVMMQSSFIQVAQKLAEKDSENCKRIDTTFFNAPLSFDKLYSYIKLAFQAMAIAQKGFYCTLCDVKNHKYMMLRQDFGKIMIAMSEKSCSQLMDYFKEFIMYKLYYLDPFIINANFMFNCYENTDKHSYKFDYRVPYQEIKACLEHGGPHCGNVCREFRFGKSSEMFMGDLSKYDKFITKFENFASDVGIDIENQDKELNALEFPEHDDEFFKVEEPEWNLENEDLTEGRLSDHQILIYNDGIDIFQNSENAMYSLEQSHHQPEPQPDHNADSTLDNFEDGFNDSESSEPSDDNLEKQINAARVREEQEKFEQLGAENRPSTQELNSLEEQIKKKEAERMEYTELTGQINDFNPDQEDERFNDFGDAGNINNHAGLFCWTLILAIVTLFV